MKTMVFKRTIIGTAIAVALIISTLPSSGQMRDVATRDITNNNAYAHYLLALQFETDGYWDGALDELNTAIELEPSFYLAYDRRGILYTKLIKYQRALRDFDKSIEINPNFAEAYNHRGITFFCLQEFEKAMVDYNKALELDPQYAKVYYNRGIVKLLLNDDNGAFNDIQIAANMNFKEAVNYLAQNEIK